MPVIKDVLQKIMDKPLTALPNIQNNFNRLIGKEKFSANSKLTEKSFRPIAELDILAKYGPIKILMDQFRDQMIPKLNTNQFSFPGKGSPQALSSALDIISLKLSKKMKLVVMQYDYSNAFCTLVWDAIIAILEEYNISDDMLDLIKQFLHQSLTKIKMNEF